MAASMTCQGQRHGSNRWWGRIEHKGGGNSGGGVDNDHTGNKNNNAVPTRAPISTTAAAAAPPLPLCPRWRHSTAAAITTLSTWFGPPNA
jgi:hypothetical protein